MIALFFLRPELDLALLPQTGQTLGFATPRLEAQPSVQDQQEQIDCTCEDHNRQNHHQDIFDYVSEPGRHIQSNPLLFIHQYILLRHCSTDFSDFVVDLALDKVLCLNIEWLSTALTALSYSWVHQAFSFLPIARKPIRKTALQHTHAKWFCRLF